MEDPGNEKGNLQKFEIGDKVYIRKDCREIFKYRADYCGEAVCFTLEMQKYCGKVATIIGKDTHYSGRDLYMLPQISSRMCLFICIRKAVALFIHFFSLFF